VRTLLRAVMYAVACAAGVDTYLYGGWLAEYALGLPQPAAQILAVLTGLVVAVVTTTGPWRIYVAIRRYTIARRAAFAIATTALPGQTEAPERAVPAGADATPQGVPVRPHTSGPARDAPFREAHVLPAPVGTETPAA
jgi:hypothetical protein